MLIIYIFVDWGNYRINGKPAVIISQPCDTEWFLINSIQNRQLKQTLQYAYTDNIYTFK